MKKIHLITLLIFIIFLHTTSAFAHPADVYTHHIHIEISQETLSVQWEIRPGPLLIQGIWFEADANQDGAVVDEEANEWLASRLPKFTATLDNENLPLQLDPIQFPSNVDAFQAGQENITIFLSADLSGVGDSYQLSFHNAVEEQKSLNWYYVTSQGSIKFKTPQQKNAQLTFEVFKNSTQTELTQNWDSSMPSLSPSQGATPLSTPQPAAPTQQQNANLEELLDLVRAKEVSPGFYVFALGISLLLGALHALTPGHGKTVVAAYLVGSRGTTWHAIVLGSVVTLTHTGSVFLLGLITLGLSQYILPTTIIPWLEVLSGLLILGLGLYLLWQRIQYWLKSKIPTAEKENANRKISLSQSSLKKPVGSVKIEKVPADLHHHGDGKLHSHTVPEAITWRSLIALGISGGLVPCPDAIAILLVAVALNRILLGLSLIISFSLGLAIVLIAIGLLMVSSRRLFDRVSFLDRLAPVMPIVSAVIVLGLGFALTWGAYARAKNTLKIDGTDSGGVNEARVIYQMEGNDGVKQLFIAKIQDSQPVALTKSPNNVVDFSLSPDDSQVIYIVQTDDLKNEIWLVNLNTSENKKISDCVNAICSQPIWSPDGSQVILEYIDLSSENASGLASLWQIDMQTDEMKPLFQSAQLPGANARWSPNGKWLSYATSENIRLYNLDSGETHVIKSILGASAAWAPDAKSVLYRDVIIQNSQFVTQLFIYDLASEVSTNVKPDVSFENILAAWSPDGEWIAVVRRDLSIPRGDQIWIMRPDGSDSHVLTNTPNALHGTLSWSEDGKYILYDLYDLDAFPLTAKLQIVDVNSDEINDLGILGYNPKWVR